MLAIAIGLAGCSAGVRAACTPADEPFEQTSDVAWSDEHAGLAHELARGLVYLGCAARETMKGPAPARSPAR